MFGEVHTADVVAYGGNFDIVFARLFYVIGNIEFCRLVSLGDEYVVDVVVVAGSVLYCGNYAIDFAVYFFDIDVERFSEFFYPDNRTAILYGAAVVAVAEDYEGIDIGVGVAVVSEFHNNLLAAIDERNASRNACGRSIVKVKRGYLTSLESGERTRSFDIQSAFDFNAAYYDVCTFGNIDCTVCGRADIAVELNSLSGNVYIEFGVFAVS